MWYARENPHQPRPAGGVPLSAYIEHSPTDITNLISLRDGLVAGLKHVAQQMLLSRRIKPLELVIGRRKGFCLEEILSQDECLERGW